MPDGNRLLCCDRYVVGSRAALIFAAAACNPRQPGSKWVAWNAVAEPPQLIWRRCMTRANQVQRSFEDIALKQRTFDEAIAA